MRVHGILNVGDIDEVFTGTDDFQPPFFRGINHTRNQMGVVRPENLMGPQRDRAECLIVGLQNHLFGHGFGFGISIVKRSRIRFGFVGTQNIMAIENHTRRAGVYQFGNAVDAASLDDVLRADDIRLVIFLIVSPNADPRSDMKHGIHSRKGFQDIGFALKIPAEGFNAHLPQLRIRTAAEIPNPVSL